MKIGNISATIGGHLYSYFFYMNPTKYCFGNYSSGFIWTICLVSWNIIKLDRFVSNWTAKNRRIWSFFAFITDINESRCNILYFDSGNTCSDVAKWLFVHRLRTDINFHISSPNLGETKSDHIMIYALIITLRWLISSNIQYVIMIYCLRATDMHVW